jgi:deoxyadenosine/deoxycytidine kinase
MGEMPAMNVRFHHIAVEGPVGVGKTALVDLMVERLGAEKINEVDNNPFLESFYEGEDEAAFLTQLFFLLSRYQQQRKLRQKPLFDRLTIADYLFDKDRIFAYVNLSDSELMLYERLYTILSREVLKPDLVIYLQADTPVLVKRIRARGRDFERRISEEYLKALNDAYNNYFFNYNQTPLLVVNTSEIDFVHRKEDLEDLLKQIEAMDGGTRYYVPCGA